MATSATITHRNTSSHTAEVYPTLNVDLLQIHGGGGGVFVLEVKHMHI